MAEVNVCVVDRTLEHAEEMHWAVFTELLVIHSGTARGFVVHIIDVRWRNGDFDRRTDRFH